MEWLKEQLFRLANAEEQACHAFFESRFRSIAILDEQALLSTHVPRTPKPMGGGVGGSARGHLRWLLDSA